eukprot:TRINITY_DN732_c1_g1_i1.p1 TRINITY_DN732_c1_g1~~TRINITY_DN732_c1_g1_i1.p1  ORF type:complete len:282 (+),score=122.26 TRINITY_DN732_c1_g1_i1:50-895(+)
MQKFYLFLTICLICFCLGVNGFGTCSFGESSVTFTCSDSLATVRSKGAYCIKTVRNLTVCSGYRQVSSDNQDPILAAWDGTKPIWCRTDIEITGDDSKGVGLLYNPDNFRTYAFFTVTGTQGTSEQDYRRFTTKGWMNSYGAGGGPKGLVVVEFATGTGVIRNGTYINASVNGKANTISRVAGAGFNRNNIVLGLWSAFHARNTNKSAKDCNCPTGGCQDTTYYNNAKLWNWEIVFDPTLNRAIFSCAPACDTVGSTQCRNGHVVRSCGTNNWNWQTRTVA